MAQALRGEIRPVMAAAFPPVAMNIERQLTLAEPMLSIQRELDKIRSSPDVLSASIALGFPYADVPEMGSAFVVVTDNQPEPPLELEVTVVSLHDGKYVEKQPRHGGKTGGNMGPCAVVRSDDETTILLMSRRHGPNGSVQPFLVCDLHPADFNVIIIRGVHAPIGAYAEHCPTLIRVNTPGVTCADMESLSYHNRRRPLFPFENLSAA